MPRRYTLIYTRLRLIAFHKIVVRDCFQLNKGSFAERIVWFDIKPQPFDPAVGSVPCRDAVLPCALCLCW